MICATWNAPAEAFENPDYLFFGGKGVADVFLPLTSNYLFCGFEIIDSYNYFDIFR
jgi:modulator of drug activity B